MTDMMSRMHHLTNNSERPPEEDAYKPITDEWGEIRLGADRTNKVYREFSFNRGFLPNVDFSDARFSALMDFRHSNGAHAKFTRSELPLANFQAAILNGADFDQAHLYRANFEGAQLGRVDKILPLFLPIPTEAGSRFHRLFSLFTPRLSQPQSPAASFRGAQLAGASFKGAELEGCDFNGADLTDTNFEDANLKNADLRNAWLSVSSLKRARSLEGAKVDIAHCIDNELQTDNPKVARLVMRLAELSATRGLQLGLEKDALPEDTLHAIFDAKTDGKISQRQLEKDFRHYCQKLEKAEGYRDLSPAEYLPYIFKRIQEKLDTPDYRSDSEPDFEPDSLEPLY